MVTYANKILYVGAGCNIQKVSHFNETKQFVFIDSQPRSGFDTGQSKFHKEFYEPNFYNDLISSCKHYGFLLDFVSVLDNNYYKKIISSKWYYTSWFYKIPNDINPTLLVFTNKNTNQRINYYISTNIKFNMNEYLRNDIASCDGIIVSEYFPEKDILRYFDRPKIFFGYTNTCYFIEDNTHNDEDNNILYFLHIYVIILLFFCIFFTKKVYKRL
jgi:hypothetical protein